MAASIHELPVELVADIFAWAIEGDSKGYARRRTVITLVSRSFHDIVVQEPSLWTTVSTKHSVRALSVALARSKSLPLQVSVDFFHRPRSSEANPVLKSFQELCLHIHRWRTARLTPRRPGMKVIHALIKPAPFLEELNVVFDRTGDSEHCVDLFNGQAPRLTSVTLRKASIPWNNGMLSGLRNLILEDILRAGPRARDLVTILASSPQLAVLKLNYVRFEDEISAACPSVQLPRLHTLEICGVKSSITRDLIRIIAAPPCRRFVFTCELNDDTHIPSLITLLRPFIPSLIPGRATVSLDEKYNCPYYRIEDPSTTWSSLFIVFEGRPHVTSAALRALLSILSPDILALDTKVVIFEGPEETRSLVTIDAAHVTQLDILPDPAQANPVLIQLAEPKEIDGVLYWLFPALHDILIKMRDVPPGALARMVKARSGHSPRSHEDKNGGNVLPLPFTSIDIHDARPHHTMDRDAVLEIVGSKVLTWRWEADSEDEASVV